MILPPAPSPPSAEAAPWFALTMTVRNNAGSIASTLASIVPELDAGGELAIVDAVSTDATRSEIARVCGADPRVRVVSEPCNRGEGRNRAIALTRAPIVLTQIDADNRYLPGVLRSAAAAVRAASSESILNAVGTEDPNPSSTRFFGWRRATLERLGGYPNVQVAEELGLVLRAYRARVPFFRFVVPRIADDLKPRAPTHGSRSPPWRRSHVTIRAAKKFGVLGYSYREFARYLAMTRRTGARYAAGLALGTVGYVAFAASGRSDRFLNDGLGETADDVARSVTSPDWPHRA
ncbi:MAG TPA: glycosyltransferase [Thermoplasmata archaeon]|nr:glycosyltransferase [Thermoplasmata archaeon]